MDKLELLKAAPPVTLAALEAWPPLIPLEQPDLPRLNADCLPDWAGDYARALAQATETPLELPAALVLTACSVATARALRLHVGPDHFEPGNLWLVAALPPGNRKSAVQTAATAPLLDWEQEQAALLAPEITRLTSERQTLEARAKEARSKAAKAQDPNAAKQFTREAADLEGELPEIPRPPQLWTSDATPERLGSLLADNGEHMAWLSSEGGVFDLLQGRYSGGIPNLDLVLKAWSGDAERVDRGGRPPVFLRQPLLTMGLSPQPEVLRGLAAKPGFRGRGLLGRFLYLLPPSPLGFRTLETVAVPEPVKAAYQAGLRAMLTWEPATNDCGDTRPHLLRLSKSARREWLEFARYIEVTMQPGGEFEHGTDWAGKCPGMAARLALVLHGIQHAHGEPWRAEITADTMRAALEIMAVITRHSLAALDLMGADEAIAAARRLWQWIEQGRREHFTIREAHQALRGSFPRVAAIREALSVLEERAYLEIIEPPRDAPGRPPSPTVRVRPDMVEGWR